MLFNFKCLHCKGIVTAPEEIVGTTVNCPICRTPIVIPPQKWPETSTPAPPGLHVKSPSNSYWWKRNPYLAYLLFLFGAPFLIAAMASIHPGAGIVAAAILYSPFYLPAIFGAGFGRNFEGREPVDFGDGGDG